MCQMVAEHQEKHLDGYRDRHSNSIHIPKIYRLMKMAGYIIL